MGSWRGDSARRLYERRNRIFGSRPRLVRTLVVIAVSIGIHDGACAQEASDIRPGRELATKFCSQCHVVAERAGPSFAEIAKGEHAAPDALLALLRSTHTDVSHPGAMPNSELTEKEIDQISAYLATLRATK